MSELSELEKRRQRPGNHEGPHAIAPYYVYYGHRYAGQAIQVLPEKERAYEHRRLLKLLLETRQPDGMWYDRVFPRARYVCTAMAVMALSAIRRRCHRSSGGLEAMIQNFVAVEKSEGLNSD